MTRRHFSLFATSLPLGLLGVQRATAQAPQALSREEFNKRVAEFQKAHQLPIALVRAEGTRKLYSSAVNSIRCWADADSTTWLGTRMGIKRVSGQPGTQPRHYTRADGLPGELVNAIVADTRGAYALIDLGEAEALCAFLPAQDTWKVLARWQKGQAEYSNAVPGFLALGQDVVVAASGLVATEKADSALFCFGRDTHEARTLPWDSGIRADHARLRITFLSCREKTVLLGTHIGLIELPLSTDGSSWTRRLTDQTILGGVEGAGRMYLWVEPRLLQRPPDSYQFGGRYPAGKLHLYDLAKGQLQSLPEKPPLMISGVVVGDDGAFWLIDGGGNNRFRRGSFTENSVMFARWKPGDTAWTQFTVGGKEVATEPPYQPGTGYDLPLIPEAKQIPDAPARFAACNAILDSGNYFNITHQSSENVGQYAALWLKKRFPHWISPEDPEALPGIALFRQGTYRLAYPDPTAAERFWIGMPQGTMALAERKIVPTPLLGDENNLVLVKAMGTGYQTSLPEAPLEQVPVPPKALELHARIHYLTALGDGTYIALGNHAFHVSDEGRRWREIALPLDQQGYPPYINRSDLFFAIGKNDALGALSLGSTLMQLDSRAEKLVPTKITRPIGGWALGADSSGAWWLLGGNKLSSLVPGSTEWKEQTLTPPEGIQIGGVPALCAGRIWWRGYQKGDLLIGWDPARNTWTMPLPFRFSYSGDPRPIADNRGRVLFAQYSTNDQREVTAYRWSADTNVWEALPPIPWTQGEQPALIAAGEDGLWFAQKQGLLYVDPAKKMQQLEPLPAGSGEIVRLWAEKEKLFLITQEGLWHFDRRKWTWNEWKVPVSTAQLSPQLAATDGTDLWGFLNAKSAGPAPLCRFEPATRRFSFYDENSGLPRSAGGSLTEAGGQIWLLHNTGAFRFDNAIQRFTQEVPIPVGTIAASQNKTVWIAGAPAQANSPTLYRWSAAAGKAVAEPNSVQNRCTFLLASKDGVLASTSTGLYRVDAGSVWTLIDTLKLPVEQLMRASDGAVWVKAARHSYLRIDTSAGL